MDGVTGKDNNGPDYDAWNSVFRSRITLSLAMLLMALTWYYFLFHLSIVVEFSARLTAIFGLLMFSMCLL